MADLDIDDFRLDAAALLNGGSREGRAREYLAEQARRLEAEGQRLERERRFIRGEAKLVIGAWCLLLTTTVALCAFWPNLMQWADWLWRR